MNARARALLTGAVAISAVVGTASLVPAPAADARTAVVMDGMPSQAVTDMASADPGNFTGGQAGWGDMPGGVAARPYVTSLSVTNDGVTTPVITDGTITSAAPALGGVTVGISPTNLCRAGQAPARNTCYVTPNRVAILVGYAAQDSIGFNFAAPRHPITPTVNANTTIDMTIALNTLGQSLRWTGVQGDLLYWRTTNLGSPDATVRIKLRPVSAPWVALYPEGSGCSAAPLRDCSIERADDEILTASLLLSLDDTLDPALTGAAFATQNAIAGFLEPRSTPEGPSLDVQVASTHTKSDGTPQLGTLKAFIPAAALLNLYGLLPSDATAFSTTRAGDRGTNAAPTYTPWTAAEQGSDGLLVTVRDITFSVPNYKLTSRTPSITTRAMRRGARATIAGTVAGCRAAVRCQATVYDLGAKSAARYVATRKVVVKNQPVASSRLSVTVPAARLPKGHRYLVVVRSAKTKKLVGSSLGSIL